MTAQGAVGRFSILLVGVSLLVVGLGQSLVFAVVPVAARRLGLSETEVGAIFGISAVFWMLMSPVWGRWSDRVGRRRVLILGLVGYALSLLSFASALRLGEMGFLVLALWPMLLLGRTINGVLGSATRPAALGYVADVTSPAQRATTLARVESGFTLGTVFGPAIGSLLLIYSLLAPFYLFAFLGLVMACVCLLLLRDPPRRPATRSPRRPRLSVLDVRLRPQLLLAAVAGISNATLLLCLGFYLEDIVGVAASEVGIYAGIGLTLAAAGAVFAQWVLVPHYASHPDLLVRTGSLVTALGIALLVAGSGIHVAGLAMALYGLGLGLLRPGNITLMSLAVRPTEQGAAAGMQGMVIPIGHLLSPLLCMPLYSWRPESPFWLASGLLLVMFILMLLHPRFRRQPWKLRGLQAT